MENKPKSELRLLTVVKENRMIQQKYWHIRSELSYVKGAIQRKKIKIGFLGGSITEQSAKHNYADLFTVQLKCDFPDVYVETQNLGIGATCSILGCLLAKEVLNHELDLVVVEYAVNDDGMDAQLRMRAREGIIQIIQERMQADIVFVYTYKETMYPYYAKIKSTELPPSVADFEQLAQHYRINSCNVGQYAFDQMQAGLVRFEEWLPDNLHPTYRGSSLYASCLMMAMIDGITSEIPKNTMEQRSLTAHFGSLQTIPFEQMTLQGPWVVKSTHEKWIDKFLYTTSIQSTLSFEVEASVVMIGTLFGETMSDLYYSVNDSDEILLPRYHESWAGEQGWYREDVLYCGEHQHIRVTIRCQKNPERLGTTTIIPHIYYI